MSRNPIRHARPRIDHQRGMRQDAVTASIPHRTQPANLLMFRIIQFRGVANNELNITPLARPTHHPTMRLPQRRWRHIVRVEQPIRRLQIAPRLGLLRRTRIGPGCKLLCHVHEPFVPPTIPPLTRSKLHFRPHHRIPFHSRHASTPSPAEPPPPAAATPLFLITISLNIRQTTPGPRRTSSLEHIPCQTNITPESLIIRPRRV